VKKLIPAAIIVAAALTLAGCGSSDSTTVSSKSSESTTTTQARRQTTTTISNQDILIEAYVSAMRDWFGSTMTRSDAISLGQTMCETIDQYGNVSDTVDAVIASGEFRGMEGDVGYVMGTAIPVFCPEYEAEARRLFR
jgi:hypothetical protein